MKNFIIGFIVLIIFTVFTASISAQNYNIKFAWDKNTESDLAGYRLYSSPIMGQYDPNHYTNIPLNILADTNNPEYELQNISKSSGKLYYILTAYDDWHNESLPSNEISFEPDIISPQRPQNMRYTITININIQ